jgi:predicted XRE-type DNA-binding protein
MNDDFTEGSGNVFADLGLPDPEQRLMKAELATRITDGIRARHLTQTRAAKLFGIDQPKISRLFRGQVAGFSIERLIHFLNLLGQDVEIVIRPTEARSGRTGRVRVVAEARS